MDINKLRVHSKGRGLGPKRGVGCNMYLRIDGPETDRQTDKHKKTVATKSPGKEIRRGETKNL